MGRDILYSHGNNHSSGVAILVKKSLKFERTATYIDQAGRILFTKLNLTTRFLSLAMFMHPQR